MPAARLPGDAWTLNSATARPATPARDPRHGQGARTGGQIHAPIDAWRSTAPATPHGRGQLADHGTDDTSNAALATLRDDLIPQTVGDIDGLEVAVTGGTGNSQDFNAAQTSSIPRVFGFVLLPGIDEANCFGRGSGCGIRVAPRCRDGPAWPSWTNAALPAPSPPRAARPRRRVRRVQGPRQPASPSSDARIVPVGRTFDLVDGRPASAEDALAQLPFSVAGSTVATVSDVLFP